MERNKVFLLLVLLFSGCATPGPDLDIQFWAGRPEKGSITRSQEDIKCIDPQFNNYVCLSYPDLKKWMSYTLSCEPK
jgi:hypothetical protein